MRIAKRAKFRHYSCSRWWKTRSSTVSRGWWMAGPFACKLTAAKGWLRVRVENEFDRKFRRADVAGWVFKTYGIGCARYMKIRRAWIRPSHKTYS